MLGRHFADEMIILCVRWYLRFFAQLSRLEELMAERNLTVDHTTVWRWCSVMLPTEPASAPGIAQNGPSWRADETYIRVAGRGRI